jgi:hypothetical protein
LKQCSINQSANCRIPTVLLFLRKHSNRIWPICRIQFPWSHILGGPLLRHLDIQKVSLDPQLLNPAVAKPLQLTINGQLVNEKNTRIRQRYSTKLTIIVLWWKSMEIDISNTCSEIASKKTLNLPPMSIK